jgi:hypothetical protein
VPSSPALSQATCPPPTRIGVAAGTVLAARPPLGRLDGIADVSELVSMTVPPTTMTIAMAASAPNGASQA